MTIRNEGKSLSPSLALGECSGSRDKQLPAALEKVGSLELSRVASKGSIV